MDPLIILAGVLALALLYVLVPLVLSTFLRWRRGQLVECPRAGRDAFVHVDALHAAATAPFGEPRLRVRSCTEWPERKGCDQACLPRTAD